MRAIAVLVVAAGCSGGPDCSIERIVPARMGDQPYTDCGTLVEFDEAAYRAAHDCVAGALAGGDRFAVVWEAVAADLRTVGAYLGIGGTSPERLQKILYDNAAPGDEVVVVTGCAALQDLGACDLYPLNQKLCFTCAGEHGLDHCPPL